jgi:hypothetical protein
MRSRITYANVAATLALFLAIGVGTSYAISVSGDDVVNGSLTSADLKNNSVKAADIAGLGANVVVRPGPSVTSSLITTAQATCNKGETLISGGFQTLGNIQTPGILYDGPGQSFGTPTSWLVIAAVPSGTQGGQLTVNPFALCAS